jgi:hypothetical protein
MTHSRSHLQVGPTGFPPKSMVHLEMGPTCFATSDILTNSGKSDCFSSMLLGLERQDFPGGGGNGKESVAL